MNHSELNSKFPGTFGGDDQIRLNPQYHTPQEMPGSGSLFLGGKMPDGSMANGNPLMTSQSNNLSSLTKKVENIEKMVTAIYNALRK